MRRVRHAAVAVAILSSACAGAPPATPAPDAPRLVRPEPLSVEGPYRHAASGMQFPTSLDGFERVSLLRYDQDGLVVSAGYNLVTPAIHLAAMVYVYPPLAVGGTREAACSQEFASRIAEILRTYPDAKLVEERDMTLPQPGVASPGRQALFAYQTVFGGESRAVSSQLHLFCFASARWEVQYRFTYPEGTDAASAVEAFLRDLVWTLGGETAAATPRRRRPLDRSTEAAG
jgi:hypothetical protein